MNFTRILFVSISLLALLPASGADLLDFPSKPVLDQAGILDRRQEEHLNNRVSRFMEQTSMEIRLVTVADVSPYTTASAYTEALYHKWKLGDKDKHNGLLMLITQKIGSSSTDMKDYCRIMTGWGIVTIIPDPVVIDDIKHGHMMPRLPSQPFLAFDNSLDRIFEDVAAWKKTHPEDTTVKGTESSPIVTKVVEALPVDKQVASETEIGGSTWIWIGCGIAIVCFFGLMIVNSSSGGESTSSASYYSQSYTTTRPKPQKPVKVEKKEPTPSVKKDFSGSSKPTSSSSSSNSSSGCSSSIASTPSCGSSSGSSGCSSSSCGSSSCGGGGCGGGGCGS